MRELNIRSVPRSNPKSHCTLPFPKCTADPELHAQSRQVRDADPELRPFALQAHGTDSSMHEPRFAVQVFDSPRVHQLTHNNVALERLRLSDEGGDVLRSGKIDKAMRRAACVR